MLEAPVGNKFITSIIRKWLWL